MKDNKKGITIIALVITIIVMLILAGVSIAALKPENGVIKKTEKAKEIEEIAQEKEILSSAIVIAINNNISGDLVKEELIKSINKESNNRPISVEEDTVNKTFIVTFTDTNRNYKINQKGNIEEANNS